MPDRIERYKPPRFVAVQRNREQAHYQTADWRAKRERILIRDAFVCRSCHRVVSGHEANVDHIVPLEDGGTDDDTNLQTLCRSCHGRKTRREQQRGGGGRACRAEEGGVVGTPLSPSESQAPSARVRGTAAIASLAPQEPR